MDEAGRLRTPARVLGASTERRRSLVPFASRFGDLPLSWKLLLPSVGLIVLLGVVGGFLVVRDLSQRSQAALELDVSRRSLDAAAVFRDGELALIESANFASNLEGISSRVAAGDRTGSARLLQSVVALKTDLQLVAVTDARGASLVEFRRSRTGAEPRRSSGRDWTASSFVTRALSDEQARKHIGFARIGRRTLLAIATPVCSGTDPCAPVGAAVVGIGLQDVAKEAARRAGSGGATSAGVAVLRPDGAVLVAAGEPVPAGVEGAVERPVRVNEVSGGEATTALYVPLSAGGRRLATFGTAIRVEPALASVRQTAFGVGLVLLAAMCGVALVGFLLSRLILRQVRSLVSTNRALGTGDLSARAQVHWNDEIGEVGVRLNEMAEQLQAMYQTLESRVAERTEEVERLHKERTEFFASVSHELRTPLAVILRHAEMLLDDGYREDRRLRVDAGSALKDSGGQLSRLIDDILELAEIEAGRLEVDLQPLDVRDLLAQMRTTIEPLARAAGLKAVLRVPSRLPLVMGDAHRLRQILLNLVDNAVKYTPEGGSIIVAATTGDDDVVVSIEDSGVGVPAHVGDRVFEPFFRVKGTETQRGQSSSGLGLAVVKRLVEAHGGAIAYRSTEGKGTTFTFTLRRADARLEPAMEAGPHEHDHA